MEGLYAVNPLQERYSDIWARIEGAIQAYTKLHPKEMAQHLLEVEQVRNEQANDHASTESKSLRWGCAIPVGLGRMLEIVEPDLFTDRRLYRLFMKKFPIFNICKKV